MSAAAFTNPTVGGSTYYAPVYSSIVAANSSLSDGKFQLKDVTAIADIGLGVLGFALNPMGAILGSAVDFLMQLIVNGIKPLKTVVDALLGEPGEINKVSAAWSQQGQALVQHGNDFVTALSQTDSWEGEGAEAYKGLVRQAHELFGKGQGAAGAVAKWVGAAGALVGLFRSFFWDALKTVVTEVLTSALLALAAAIPTLGGSIAAFGTWFAARMASIIGKFASNMAKLLKKMGDLAGKLNLSRGAFDKAADSLTKVASSVNGKADSLYTKAVLNSDGHVTKTPWKPPTVEDWIKDQGKNNPNSTGWQNANTALDNYNKGKDIYDPVKKGAGVIDPLATGGNTGKIEDLPEGY